MSTEWERRIRSAEARAGSTAKRRPACLLLALTSSLVFCPLVAEGVTAQVPTAHETKAEAVERRSRSTQIAPHSGPPGTVIMLRAADLPAVTPVHLAIGGTRSGFEALSFVRTDERGELEVTVEVPAWSARDATHRFIVFDTYFEPLAMTEFFHVTDPAGMILREGRIVDAGPVCTGLTAVDGELYSFVERTERLELGKLVAVEAKLVESSDCLEGIPIEVSYVRPLLDVRPFEPDR